MSLQVKPPEDVLIPLSDGDWILVKKWLNAGESQEIFARMVKSLKPGDLGDDGTPKAQIDYHFEQMGGLSKAVAYLIDWSAKGADGSPIVIRGKSARFIESALKSLPQSAFAEIAMAIEAHEKQMEAELAALKNVPATGSESSATSSSVA